MKLFCLGMLSFLLGFCLVAGAAIAMKHNDSVGFVMQQTNPNIYVEGSVVNVASVGDGLNVRIQPRGVYALYTDEILFCDARQVEEAFEGKSNPVVLTYDRVAHRTIDGVGCHDLKFVDNVAQEHP